MLSVLLLAGLVTAIALALGVALLSLFDPEPPRFLAAALAGFALLCALAALAGLFIPLGAPLARGALYGVAAAVAIVFRRRLAAAIASWRARARALSRWALLAGAILALAILGRASGPVICYDSGLYHAQAIRWAEEAPALPGLGNLHIRLVHSPAWFPAAALFSLRDQPPGPHRPLGAALALWLVLAFTAALDDVVRGSAGAGRLVTVLLGVAMVHVLFLWLSSPSPDVGAALLAWGVLLLVLDAAEGGFSGVPGSARAAVVAVAAAAPFVTASAVPLALPAAVLLATAGTWRTRAALAFLALAIAAPFLARNTVLSGFPLYPLTFPALDVDWRIPEALVADELAWVKSWARVPRLAPEVVLAMPAREWVPRWWKALFLSDKALLAASAALLVPGAVRLRRSPAALLVLGTCLFALVTWLVAAPDPRLAWGFLVPLPLLLAASFVPPRARPRAALLAIAVLAAVLLRNTEQMRRKGEPAGGWGALLTASAYPPAATHESREMGFAVRVPDVSDQCWDAPLPCTPYPWVPVARRGRDLPSGFRHPAGAPIVPLPR